MLVDRGPRAALGQLLRERGARGSKRDGGQWRLVPLVFPPHRHAASMDHDLAPTGAGWCSDPPGASKARVSRQGRARSRVGHSQSQAVNVVRRNAVPQLGRISTNTTAGRASSSHTLPELCLDGRGGTIPRDATVRPNAGRHATKLGIHGAHIEGGLQHGQLRRGDCGLKRSRRRHDDGDVRRREKRWRAAGKAAWRPGRMQAPAAVAGHCPLREHRAAYIAIRRAETHQTQRCRGLPHFPSGGGAPACVARRCSALECLRDRRSTAGIAEPRAGLRDVRTAATARRSAPAGTNAGRSSLS